MPMILHLATTTELLGRARCVREKVFTIEKKIPKSIEVDELDCLNDVCNHFVVEVTGKGCSVPCVDESPIEGKQTAGRKMREYVDVCALRCKKLSGDKIQLQRFCVLKDYRETGVGRWTLQQIEEYYWKKDVEVITLDAKFHVSGFYEKCGYMVVSEPFIEAGVEHVVMEKRRK